MAPSDQHLVAIVLARGREGRELVPAASLLEEAGGLLALSRLDAGLLAEQLGGKRPIARLLAAAFELGRRAVVLEARSPRRFACSADAAAWASPRLATLGHEELWLLGLDSRGGLLAARNVAKGGLHGVGAKVPDVLRTAIGIGSSAFALVHNHPGGDPAPSAEDVHFTRVVARAAKVVLVPLVDHVIVGRSGFCSVPFDG